MKRNVRALLATLVIAGVVVTGQIAGAVTGATSDPDDTTGLDIASVAHSDDATNVTLGFQTFEDFTNTDFGNGQFDLDLDGAAGLEDCILLVKVSSNIQAELYNDCGTESFAQYPVTRPANNRLQFIVPIADLRSIGLSVSATSYNYAATAKGATTLNDRAPNGTAAITHTFGPDPTPTASPTPSPTPLATGLQQATDTQGVNGAVAAGILAINAVDDNVTFGSITAGQTKTAAVGDVDYTNTRNSGFDWTVTVQATSLVNGTSRIGFTNLKFKPGAALDNLDGGASLPTANTTETAFTGTDSTTGQPYSNPVTMATAPAATQGNFRQSGSTLKVSVPSTGIPGGTYTGSLQYTITG